MLVGILAYLVAATLIVLLPGPDTLVVVRSMIRGGRRQGVLTALGNLTGLTVWVVAASLGLAALLRASEVGYGILRVVGACYLIFLGISAWRSRGQVEVESGSTDGAEGTRSAQRGRRGRPGVLGTGYRAGVLTNLLNPKVGVFFVSFLPGFVPKGEPVALTSLVFGAIFVILTAAYWVMLLGLAGKVTRWMATPSIRRRLDAATAVVLMGFGLRLVTE